MRVRLDSKRKLLFLLLLAILIMGIGYSAINSITAEIQGKVIAEAQQGVFITNVEHVSNIEANLSESEIQYYKGTYMQSKIELSETEPDSEITYKVTVYNNSENSYPFLDVLYDKEFYDNENIVFEIGDNGFKIGDIINAKETKEIYITFKYKDGVIPENKILNSNLNFKIANRNRMILAENREATTTYLNSEITKDKIENIKFELGNTEPEDMISKFDASEKQDKSIMGYYTDTDKNGLYELTFASDETIFPNINAQFLFQNLTNLKGINFENFSTYGETSMQSMFERCGELTTLDVSKFDTSNVTNMFFMFNGCRKLMTLDVSKFDTSNVRYMAYMFCDCNELTSLDVSNFNTSNVTEINAMFLNCSELTNLDVSNFNTSNITNIAYMFCNCSKLTSLDVSNFSTSNVTDIEFMFARCSKLTSLDISEFDTSNVTNMYAMFNDCSKLTSLDLSSFNTSNVTNMGYMFNGCSELASLDLINFNTNNVTNMELMFSNCSNLTTIYVKPFDSETKKGWTTLAVTTSSYMFASSTKLVGGNGTTYDASRIDKEYARIDEPGTPGYFTNEKVLNINRMVMTANTSSTTNYLRGTVQKNQIETIKFELGKTAPDGTISSFDASEKEDGSIIGYYTDINDNGLYELSFRSDGIISPNINAQFLFQNLSSLKEIDFENFTTNGVTSMQSMFERCTELTTLDVSKFDTSNVTNMFFMFFYCSRLTSLDVTKFDTSNVRYIAYMFCNCSGLTSLDVTKFDTSSVTEMNSMFSDCSELTTLDLSNFNTSNVTNISWMFANCSKLTGLNLSNFNTSNVNNMDFMFANCSELKSLNISNFNTSNVTSMNAMFNNCSRLTSLDLSGFDINNVTNMSYMFNGCSGLTSLDLSSFNTNNVTNMELMLSNCSELTTIYATPFNQETNIGWTTSAVTISGQMFASSTKLVGGNGTTYDWNHIDAEYARIDTDETPGYFSKKIPMWTRVSSTANAIDPDNNASSTATIIFRGTDDNFGTSTLTIDDIQVLVNGNVVTSGITKTLDSTTALTDNNGTQYGVEYTVTIKGFAQNANQVKIRIPKGKMVDQDGNDSKETDLILYNV